DWVRPGGFGPTLATLLDTPTLIGVAYVDAARLEWIGGLGTASGDTIVQDTRKPSWDFPLGDFGDAPFFETTSDGVAFVVADWPLPIEDFFLSGTFAPDGRSVGGMVLSGTVDTRHAGGALGQDDDRDAICAFASGLGVDCEPCV